MVHGNWQPTKCMYVLIPRSRSNLRRSEIQAYLSLYVLTPTKLASSLFRWTSCSVAAPRPTSMRPAFFDNTHHTHARTHARTHAHTHTHTNHSQSQCAKRSRRASTN